MGDRDNLFGDGIGMTRSWKLQKKCCVIRSVRDIREVDLRASP